MRYKIEYLSEDGRKWLSCEDYEHTGAEADSRLVEMQAKFPARQWRKTPVRKTYINRLQDENAALKRELEGLRDGISALKQYLNSRKFHCGDEKDGYVAVEDVFLRLREAETLALNRAANL